LGQQAAEIVREFRESNGISQEQLAAVLKTTQSYLSGIENGGSISKRIAKKLAAITEKPLELFV